MGTVISLFQQFIREMSPVHVSREAVCGFRSFSDFSASAATLANTNLAVMKGPSEGRDTASKRVGTSVNAVALFFRTVQS